MSNPTSTEWSSDTQEAAFHRRVALFAVKGIGVGLLAGMGAFVYNAPQFVTVAVDMRLLLVPVFAAGVFAHLFADSLRRSVRLGLAGFFLGLVVFVGAWVAPLWILSYPAPARDVLLPKMVGDAMSAAFLTFSAAYLGGYLLTVSIAAYWE